MAEPLSELFAALDAPPRAAFVDGLRTQLLAELGLEAGAPPDRDPAPEPEHEEDEAIPMAELTAPLPTPSRRWRTLAVAATAIAAAAAIAYGLVARGGDDAAEDSHLTPATVPADDLEQPEITDPDGAGPIAASIDVDALNLGVSDRVVVAGTLSELVRVDGRDNRVLARRSFQTLGAVLAEGSAWAIDRRGVLHRLDAETLETELTLEIPGATGRRDGGFGSPLAYEGGRLWAVTGDALVGVDPATMTEVVRTPVPGADDLTAGFGSVFVRGGSEGAYKLVRVSASDGKVTANIPLPGFVRRLEVGAGSVWATDEDHGDVLRIEPLTGTLVATIDLGDARVNAMAIKDTEVWVGLFNEDAIVRIDPATNAIVERVDDIDAPAALSFSGGTLWIANAQSALTRFETGR